MKTIKYSELCEKLGKFIRVENLDSRNGCGKAPNQFELTFENGFVMQSYNSIIGAKIDGQYYFTNYHDYSNTTSSHCTRWCMYNCKERRKGLENEKFIFIEM